MNPLSTFLDLVAPPQCFVCGRPPSGGNEDICRACSLNLPWWRQSDGCPKCGTALFSPGADLHFASDIKRPPDSLEAAGCPHCLASGSGIHLCRAALRYVGQVRLWIPALKNTRGALGPSAEVRNAIDFLSQVLATRVLRETRAHPDLILPIPLHPSRKLRRGFNHADLIASRLAKSLGHPWHPDLLKRTRATRPQAHLVGEKRRANLRGAFRVRRPLGSARTIWLVDDVLTTGSTLEAAADALIEAGAEEVRALTLAATLPASRSRPAKGAKSAASAYHPSAPETDRP